MKDYRSILPLLSALLLTACQGQSPAILPPASPGESAPGASATPDPGATPAVSSSSGASPTPEATSATPAPGVTPAASATPGASPSPDAPAATTPPLDISVIESTTLNGKVFDLGHAPLDGVKVVVRSLSDSTPFEADSVTVGGSYSFNAVPAGIQLEIIASKEGYASRRRVEVIKSNKTGDPRLNRYDFGTDGTAQSTGTDFNALTDSPEVIAVTPGRNESQVAASSAFKLSFSEPVDRATVERAFTLRAFKEIKLTADLAALGATFSGDGNPTTIGNDLIFDKNAFTISWNSASTEVTFAFKDDKALPTDKDSSRVPTYEMLFNSSTGRAVNDASGVSRNSLHFRLTDGSLEETVRFSLAPDITAPYLTAMTVQTAENGGTNGDSIQVIYSKPMQIQTLTRLVAGGMDDRSGVPGAEGRAPAGYPDAVNASLRNAAKNYNLQIAQAGGESLAMSWFALGGSAYYDGRDATWHTILLLPPRQGALSAVVGGAPANNDTISATALLKNGSSVPLATQTLKTQTVNSADHVAATVNLLTAATETLTFYYTDGSSEVNVDLSNPAANTYAELKNALGGLTNGGSGDWTVNALLSGGGGASTNVTAGDRVNILLAANATRNGKPIARVELNGGIFAANQLNMSGYSVVTSQPRLVQAALNGGFGLSGGRFSVSETDAAGGAGNLAAGDTLTLGLSAGPRIDNKTVLFVTIQPTGLFAPGKLNTPAGGYIIYPNTAVDAMVDLFQPGDALQLQVAPTVIDPAGNTLDASRNRVNATAS